nr:hypothetical protein Itr_chr14CG04310 [Ipomoea trifida]
MWMHLGCLWASLSTPCFSRSSSSPRAAYSPAITTGTSGFVSKSKPDFASINAGRSSAQVLGIAVSLSAVQAEKIVVEMQNPRPPPPKPFWGHEAVPFLLDWQPENSFLSPSFQNQNSWLWFSFLIP